MIHRTRLWLLILVCLSVVFPVQAQKLFEESNDLLPREIERMYTRGLQYLVDSQLTTGNFKDKPYGTSPAVVGLAIVAMRRYSCQIANEEVRTSFKIC